MGNHSVDLPLERSIPTSYPIMSTIGLLRARLDELLAAQVLPVQESAQLVLSIPQIIDSQVYGLVLRKPHAFIAFLRSQLKLAGHDMPPAQTMSNSDPDLTAQINELRTFIYVHLRRADLHEDAQYSLTTRVPEGFTLPGESQNLDFADAFLAAADALLPGHSLSNSSDDLIPFARAFLSAVGRAKPSLLRLLRDGREPYLALAWFIICLYKGSPDISNPGNFDHATLSAGVTSGIQIFGCVLHSLAKVVAHDPLDGLGDVARQFRRAPGIPFTLPRRSLPEELEIFSLHLWQQLNFSEQEIARFIGNRLHDTNRDLWYGMYRYEEAFFAYCRQLVAGNFDASVFRTSDAKMMAGRLMQFILQDDNLRISIEGIQFLHNPPVNADGMQQAEVHEWNARLFAQWKTQTSYDDDEDIDIATDRMLSTQLLERALANRALDVEALASQQLNLDAEPHAPFPGFEASETSDTAAPGPEDDFSVICLFCTSRLSDSEQSGGELVYNLSCCGGRAGAVCLKAYKQSSQNCPFCSQAM